MASEFSLLRRIATAGFAAAVCFVTTGVQAESNLEILHTWTKTFNVGDPTALKAFQQRYRGNSDVAFALDTRDETGGFDLVKVETDVPTELTALLRQRNYPSLWRISMSRATVDSLPLKKFSYLPVPVPQKQALASVRQFANRLAAADKFSGVLAVAQHGKQVFAKGWGFADRERKRPVTPDTQFLFASQGKMFTAVAILQLIERGQLKLDDAVGRYLTDYPNAEVARKVTIRELLTHEGGVGDIDLLQPGFAANRAGVHSIGDIIKLNGQRGPAFAPGSKSEYSNYGFVLLGAIVEKISRQSFYDYVATHIFQPSGMNHTSYPLREQMTGMAVPYSNFNSESARDVSDELPWRGTPAGGGVSTSGDMIRFVAALNAGKLLSSTLLAEAVKHQSLTGYGYGFIVSQVENFPYWGHGGGAPGQSLVLDYYPLTDTTFICMSNRDPIVCDRLAFNFLFRSRTSH